MTFSIKLLDQFVAECGEKRKTRYVGAPRNVYRHVIMSDIKDATTSLPRVSYLILLDHRAIDEVYDGDEGLYQTKVTETVHDGQ